MEPQRGLEPGPRRQIGVVAGLTCRVRIPILTAWRLSGASTTAAALEQLLGDCPERSSAAVFCGRPIRLRR